jgi:type I restriction enzyme S subunit
MADECTFGELLLTPLRNGVSYATKNRGHGVAMINMREIFAFDRIGDQDCELAPLTKQERDTYLLREHDLLFARQSLTFEGAGKCVLVLHSPKERTWESHLIRARLDPTRAWPPYYYYYFRSPAGRKRVEAIVHQVAAAGIRGSDLERLLVPKRPLALQNAVAEVLAALDDKIAANELAIHLVETLTDAEFTNIASRASGRRATFGEVAEVGGGGTPRTSVEEYWSGDIHWATPTDITNLRAPYLEHTSRMITRSGLDACSSRLHPEGSILMTSRATIGAFAIAQVPLAVNQGFIVVNAHNPINQWWLFHEMRARTDEFLRHANGATFLELSRGKFKSLPIQMPTPEQAMAFAAKVRSLHSLGSQLVIETETLAATRDELLPLLMSGRIRVRDAEKVVEEVV